MPVKQAKVADLLTAYQNKSQIQFPIKPFMTESDNIKSVTIQIKEFTEKTSCHGVNRITDTQTHNNWFHWKNIVWLLLTLVSLGMACHSLIEILEDYTSYPVTTTTSSGYEPLPEFPTITFCNLNLVRPDRMPVYSTFEDFWHSQFELKGEHLSNQDKLLQIISRFGSLSDEEKKAYGHNLEETLIDCQFNGKPCSADDFYWTYDDSYGNCYSFNFGFSSNGSKQSVRRAMTVGYGTGLALTLDIQSDQYMEMTKDVGLKLMIHKSGVFPSIEEDGMFVSPGYVTSIGLNKVETILVERPYGICIPLESDGNKNLNMYSSLGYSYSRKVCQWSCEQAHVINECGCCERNIPCNPQGLREAFGIALPLEIERNNLTTCNSTDRIDQNCITRTLFTLRQNGVCSSQCYPECKSISYHTKPSLAAWPNKMQTDDIFGRMNGSARLLQNASTEQQYSFIRENAMALDIHFGAHTKTVIRMEPTYTWSLLLSNVGGQLGLWLGFSLLTAVEFVELTLDIFIHGFKIAFRFVKARCVLTS